MGFAAKFAGFCPACKSKYAAGTQITKGAVGWVHVSCPSGTTAPVTTGSVVRVSVPTARRSYRTRPGRWTGCSCGSRENSAGDLIPARNNCSSCEYDA